MHRDRFLPTHRLFLWSLAATLAASIAWMCLAQLDIVATAQGKLVPSGFARIAQPVESGAIKAVLVRDGQTVAAGQPLVEMDGVSASEDTRHTRVLVERLALRVARLDAALADKPFAASSGTPELRAAAEAEHTLQQQALASALAEAAAARERAAAEERAAQERLTRATRLQPLVSRQSAMQRELQAQGFVSESAATDKLKELVDVEQELATQRQASQAARVAVQQAERSRERLLAEHQRQLAGERAQAQTELTAAEAELAKSSHRMQAAVLRAPVAGTVNGLAALQVGQVVPAGATLMSIVPAQDRLQFDGWLRNEDAAYVAPGMPARVKVAAYPFQKYGWLDGEVHWIGVDSETPESMRNAQGEPLFYRVRVVLQAQALTRDGQPYPLKTGSQAVADVQLGRRTLFEYLTSPLRKVLLEAARERG